VNIDKGIQKACVWIAVVALVVVSAGIFIAMAIPPPRPSDSAAQVAARYVHHHDRIRIGSFLTVSGAGFLVPFVAAIGWQMRRMAGNAAGLLAVAQIAAGTLGCFMFIVGPIFWMAAAFRPEAQSGGTLIALQDTGNIPFFGVGTWAMVQTLALAAGVLTDQRDRPVYPRWFGYLGVWVAVLFIPAPIDMFFKTGPFAYNGLFVFWLPGGAFFLWFGIAVWLTLRAIDAEAAAAT
jgi:hypothetical protein